jgi:ribosomal 30S subunit maturation factor RimM
VIIPASTQLPIDHTDLNDYEIHDLTTGIRVVIEEVIEMPSQLMAQVSLNQKPYLIPLVPTLIERIDDITKEIEIHLPHGIFEL